MFAVAGKSEATIKLDQACVNGQTISMTEPGQRTKPAPHHQLHHAEHASICLHGVNNLSLVNFPESQIVRIRDICVKYWSPGIMSASWVKHHRCHLIKLCGAPWSMSMSDQRTLGLLLELFAGTYADGWIVSSTIALEKCKTHGTLTFTKKTHPHIQAHEWLTCALDHNPLPSLRVHNAPQNLGIVLRERLHAAHFLEDSHAGATGTESSSHGKLTTITRLCLTTGQTSSLAQVARHQRLLLLLAE